MRLLLLTALLFASAPTLIADSFEGTWKLNSAKSSGTLPAAETVVIRKQKDLLIVEVSIVTTAPANAAFVIKYSAPEKGGDGHVEQGPYNGVSLKRIGSHELETVYLTDGKKVRMTRATVAKDGKSMTSVGTVIGSDAPAEWKMYFEKQ
jgi:hypothetical protein